MHSDLIIVQLTFPRSGTASPTQSVMIQPRHQPLILSPYPVHFSPPVPTAAPLLPPFDPPDISSSMATTLPHPMNAEVNYDGSSDDAPAEPAGHCDDLALPTPAGSAGETPDAPAEPLDGLVPAV